MRDSGTEPRSFLGVVYLQEALKHRDGRWYNCVAGQVTIHSDQELLGFKTRGTQANWCASVRGEVSSMNILGCQIRAIEEELTASDGMATSGEVLVMP